ncbi:vWA domain-containing protein [Embleya sp. MST-111070]|uniref:vWA domain-containing protein n=1 Tax=Embleya sp. MST-111070 TaxID=3398231 RepID=UPI003F733FE3
MAARRAGGKKPAVNHADKVVAAREAGWSATDVAPIAYLAHLVRHDYDTLGPGALGHIGERGTLTVDRHRYVPPLLWERTYTHLLLHLALGHLDGHTLAEAGLGHPAAVIDDAYNTACCVAVHRFADGLGIGTPLTELPRLPDGDERELTQRWRLEGVPEALRRLGTNGTSPCLRREPPPTRDAPAPRDWPTVMARGLVEMVAASLESAMAEPGEQVGVAGRARTEGPWDRALSWFVSSYPLLGALAAGLTVVADAELARSWGISIAAVSAEHGEIYVNPHVQLSVEEWQFVLAHEMLHAALRHDRRREHRDAHLFNVACDYVINGWLVEMGVGVMPDGLLYDARLTGLSAESVYDTLTTDLRRARKLRTPGSREHGDMLGEWLSEPAAATRRSSRRGTPGPLPARPGPRVSSVDLDAFYRRALTAGLAYHDVGRGLLPAGLVEEIRTLEQPPPAWDVRLARWFDEHVRRPETVRTYARAGRRQAATPDIPRPGRVRPEDVDRLCTFGVVLDTSGSMDTTLLGKALGAIASYASARDVPAARVVYCDAAAYDAGYLPVEDIAQRAKVRGRGGTVLQPGIRLLEGAADFPPDGPILVITDGDCDVLRIRREHAFLVPAGARLPFSPRGPVFRVG